MAEKEVVSYHLPSLGTVATPLHDESAVLFRLLTQAREVDRLMRLDHLGTIRMAWAGAHHPRWEYVVSILDLVNRCSSPDTPEIHLKSKVSDADVVHPLKRHAAHSSSVVASTRSPDERTD